MYKCCGVLDIGGLSIIQSAIPQGGWLMPCVIQSSRTSGRSGASGVRVDLCLRGSRDGELMSIFQNSTYREPSDLFQTADKTEGQNRFVQEFEWARKL
jgi:hypothetical protein